jgi:hypothetical protein
MAEDNPKSVPAAAVLEASKGMIWPPTLNRPKAEFSGF